MTLYGTLMGVCGLSYFLTSIFLGATFIYSIMHFPAMLMLELTVIRSTVVLFQRFTTTAAELNGALYVAGGYDFNKDSYLQL
jgi:hypothetical protein